MTDQQYILLREWLKLPNHKAGILTNRPSRSPDGYLSSPEAELGMALIGLEDLPYVGSGILAWFAVNNCQLPDHALTQTQSSPRADALTTLSRATLTHH
jgi:hypothetical protein